MSHRNFKTIVSKIKFFCSYSFLAPQTMSICTNCCQPRLLRACFLPSSLVILLSSSDQASTPQIPIKRCPLPSLPNIDLLHHHASSITPGLFSAQGRQNHLKWLSFSLPQCAQFSRPSPAVFCLSALPFAASSVSPSWPSRLQDLSLPQPSPENVFLPFCRIKPYSLLNLSSKVSSRRPSQLPV